MKMKLIKTIKLEEQSIDIYENSLYRLEISKKDRFANCSVGQIVYKGVDYLPDIFLRKNFDNFLFDSPRVQTTSYGSLETYEIEKVIHALNLAMESAKEIEEILKQNNLLNIKNS